MTLSHLRKLRHLPSLALAICAWAAAAPAQALTISALSPQGEVSQVRQVRAKFNEAVVNFGDPKAGAPLTVSCDNADAAKGQGVWTSASEWVFQFAADLPPGVRCKVDAVAGLKAVAGSALSGTTSFAFYTGGPFVQHIRPHVGEAIEEDQVFVLRLNGAATAESVRNNVWCSVDGLGERVPTEPVTGEARTTLLKAVGMDQAAQADPLLIATLRCNRRLTPASRVQIVYGKGVRTPSGIQNNVERRFSFKVREPFTAKLTCERENAQAACLPIRPIELEFSAPVTRRLLEQVRLRSDKTEYQPVFDDDTGKDTVLQILKFPVPLPERTGLTVTLPPDLKDASGRPLANAASFPLRTATGPMPPLAKFSAAPFGVVERFAEGPGGPALLPVTLRYVEPNLKAQAFQISQLQPQSDADIIAWFTRVQAYNAWMVPRKAAAKDLGSSALPKPINQDTRDMVEARMLSLLAGKTGVQTVDLPPAPGGGERPFEVVGLPLTPGYHVIELTSHRLGQSLLDEKYGANRPMVVRTSALVTNLGVHFKLGRDNALAWVTTLDKGKPVEGAAVRISDCRGREVASATTDAQGIARFKGVSPQAPRCDTDGPWTGYEEAYFVSARAQNNGAQDLAFTWSTWKEGIEPWRFNVPTSTSPTPSSVAHTVFDRTLLRAGETVSMKHMLRSLTSSGFALPKGNPDQLVITHVGSGQQYTSPLKWRNTATGGRSAESTFAIPSAAKLGVYSVALRYTEDKEQESGELTSGQFRVEEFRLPVLQGSVAPEGKEPLIAATRVPLQVQINYVSGGPANGLPVRVSALTRERSLSFDDYPAFHFDAPKGSSNAARSDGEEESTARDDQQVVANKLALTLDRTGVGKLALADLKPSARPQNLQIEATFADPNGEIQTLRGNTVLWPAGVIAGIKADDWVSASQTAKVQALALDLAGKPKAGVPLDVKAVARITTTSRKRMVGGFYTYDNRTETKDLGTVCTGTSDARGLLNCDIKLGQPGEIELVVSARDDQARAAQAAASIWVTRQGELWFGGENHDRMDVLTEKKVYQGGDTARLQVRMPFRYATALLAVEREGIVHTEVVELRGDDPTIDLKIDAAWGPNVYVSVLALRGRLHDVPWYSFFTWGFKSPREWWRAYWHESKDYVAATPLVDLSKPAFRFGMAELRIGTKAHELAVEVKADQPTYQVRGKAQVIVQVRLPDGKPAANAEVALAAVDQALLELMPNTSWKLLDAMLQRREWGVETSTAQMEIIGRRHYGRKAVPAGGDGGGRSPTRELLDTLLLWQPHVQLDAQGQAKITVPLNDALTTFQIVAVADAGAGQFGTGQTAVRTTQDLQIISGLPPLVREGDEFNAMLTLRNTTAKPMKVEVAPRATLVDLKPQTIDIPPGEARELHWAVTAPQQLAATRAEAILWEIEARDTGGSARDALKVNQRIVPAVPLTVQQATLTQLDGPFELQVAPPADALPASGPRRGGLKLALQPKLAEGLPGVRDWFARYPYSCLEQQTSKSIGLRDEKLWQRTVAQMPAYLDSDGLAYYFPPTDSAANRGSDTLTAWLLAATHEAAQLNKAFALPDALRAQMISGLTAFVEGRIERKHWAPTDDLTVRKLAAIEALSRHGAAKPAMVTSLSIAPNQWPTSAVIDWVNVLRALPGIAEQPRLLAESQQILRARLSTQGTRMVFSTEREDHWWWLMAGGDVNSARLLLAVMGDAAWKDELPRLISGFIARQQGGAWSTTTANLWGGLALEQFSRRFESTPVAGITRAALSGQPGAPSGEVDWAKVTRLKTSDAQGAGGFGAQPGPGSLVGNTLMLPWGDLRTGAPLTVTHTGTGKPWLTLQSLAAIELKAPMAAGYQIKRSVTAVEQADKNLPAGQYSRGDVLRITLEINASADMTWVAVTDPVPTGATILGSGLGRDSAIATVGQAASGGRSPAFVERSFEAYRAYYDHLPKGTVSLEYTVRLSNAGTFQLPPTRVEALYAPEVFGAAPNARITVKAP